ncbi:sugar phosphate isomerase/epimerase family protein [Pacificibacter marinus]|uniref:D-tagatose 3-epimerase n=1 Tax=Pacificibacter marinus TaxID=658057 RepID=A0A1Y5RCJ7_9RHOB|nr:sugar phosphate isomerase/epimerase family protein [Pacificibacter marinus]SEK27976.1 D-tagatose 3-epimerase [Pacificibacter marinus]SLN11532.1 D-tagatose 3-epimerase [Pacificibacter marinus]
MKNPIGIISMQFVRPFTGKHLHLFRDIKSMGYDFIELLVPEPEDGIDLAAAKSALADADLGIVLAARVNPQRSISSEDASARQGGLDYLKSCIDSANALGATIIGGPLYGEPMVFAGRPPLPRSADDMKARADRMIEGLAQVAPLARAAGQTFAVEPLNRFETDMLNTTRQGVTLVDTVNDAGLGLMLDTFHMNMEDQSIPDAIRLAGKRTVHFQANENHRGFPGTGNMDWPAIMRALHQVGYTGPVSLEPFRRDDQRLALPIAHWRAPAEDETPKLKAGHALIRAALDFAEYEQ